MFASNLAVTMSVTALLKDQNDKIILIKQVYGIHPLHSISRPVEKIPPEFRHFLAVSNFIKCQHFPIIYTSHTTDNGQ